MSLHAPVTALTRARPQAPTALLTPPPVASVRFGIRVAGFGLLLPPERPAEVLARPALYQLHHSPVWLAGLFPLRGHLLPAIDLTALLGGEPQTQAFILVLGQREQALGLLMDTLPHTLQLPPPLPQLPPLPAVLAPHVGAAYETPAGLWLDWQDHAFIRQLQRADAGGSPSA